ncbi:MAG: phosphonate ABC transporter ATP-binding protein [Roseiarcus sp.]
MSAVQAEMAPGAETRLAVRGLRMRYPNGKLALDGVDLTVRAGELVTILGSNGSGKTTLLRCIARLQDPTEGQVLVGGQDLARLDGEALREARLALAMVFQRANLVRRRSVLANVASGTLGRRRTLWTMFGGLPAEELPMARELLRKVGVERLGAQRADTLSGGQAQRAAIARALAQRPKLILADEPVASLDPEAAEEIMRLLRQLAVESGLAVLCVLHQPALAQRYSHRVVGLRDGVVVFDLPADFCADQEIALLYRDLAA